MFSFVSISLLLVEKEVPPLFRLGDPALYGSHPMVTPYYCRLGDLLCFVCVIAFCVICVFFVPSVL